MQIQSISLSYIRSFKSLHLDLKKTRVLVGPNDHGKSSILKVLDILMNQITDEMIEAFALDPAICRHGFRLDN